MHGIRAPVTESRLKAKVGPRYTSNDILKTLFGVHAQVSYIYIYRCSGATVAVCSPQNLRNHTNHSTLAPTMVTDEPAGIPRTRFSVLISIHACGRIRKDYDGLPLTDSGTSKLSRNAQGL